MRFALQIYRISAIPMEEEQPGEGDYRNIKENIWELQENSCPVPLFTPHSSWRTFGVLWGKNLRSVNIKSPWGCEIKQRLNPLFPVELQGFCWEGTAEHSPWHVRDSHEVKAALWGFIGVGWPTGDASIWVLRGEINPNTHNTSGQPQCTAPLRWTRRWSNKWGLCPAGRRGFPALGVEPPGWAHFSSCSSFLHRKPWLCNLLLRWDTGSGGKRAKGNMRGSWNYQDTNPSLLAGRAPQPSKTLRWGFIQN